MIPKSSFLSTPFPGFDFEDELKDFAKRLLFQLPFRDSEYKVDAYYLLAVDFQLPFRDSGRRGFNSQPDAEGD